jgi:hypothetical protein
MQLQGEVLEENAEKLLKELFPLDVFEPVAKGKKGGDIIQTVRLDTGRSAGTIVWELKNTKTWQANWLDKLKQDQRDCQADLAVIASVVLPEYVKPKTFDVKNGIWITDVDLIPTLAVALRENLKALVPLKAANAGKADSAAMIYDYLTGVQFKQRVEAIVDAHKKLKDDIDTERLQMEKFWSKRATQLNQFTLNIAGMVGDIQGRGIPVAGIKYLEITDDAA